MAVRWIDLLETVKEHVKRHLLPRLVEELLELLEKTGAESREAGGREG